ncbi:hypothetical protein QBC42DRAFT_236340 [Cladorrhinum samala]|uniref:Uncharacterized protein n=1 Tax=Cladorrhinum samala TaxID=585594 RepID=A0AAV9HB40_9PEZI|nr:hypothetical protein QBC42DRAFT_236340 [Cladorrhinum samala]
MDHPHTTRRSASHGALGRSYTAEAFHPHRRPFPRHPLRNVNENFSLLPSPGPLESMLKTTTETGDIGLFSIRPVRSSSSIPGQPRHRPSYGDPIFSRPLHGERIPQGSSGLRDDRRWLPPYRDTTSEIISMYGSDSMRSAASSFTPPFDDRGPRSYSMTTCSSRPLPNQKSASTMHSHPSNELLQRPRSPFPYPTRLKRPGVRPSSPALTESGAVDYSRMPTYPQPNSRPLPRARFDGSRSSEYSSGYSMSPVSPAAWGNRYRPRLNSSASEHSLRSSSLTSIVNMYQRSTCGPPSRKPSLRVQSLGAFYYDYSEGFDHAEEPLSLPDFPVHISGHTRSRSLCQQRAEMPNRLRGLDEANDGKRRQTRDATTAALPNDAGTHSQLSDVNCDESGAWNPRLPPSCFLSGDGAADEEMPADSPDGPKTAISPRQDEETWSVGTAVVHKRQNATLTSRGCPYMSASEYMSAVSSRSYEDSKRSITPPPARTSSHPTNSHRSLSGPWGKQRSDSLPHNGLARRSRIYSVEPGLSDFSSLKYSTISTPSLSRSHETSPGSSGQLQDENRAWQSPRIEETLLDTAQHDVSHTFADVIRFRGCKRTCAAPRIRTGNLLATPPESDPHLAVDRSQTPLLAPLPISPVRQLRLQNSVPQLMKALPPLPGGSAESELFTGNISSDELDECAMRFSPIDLSSLTMPKLNHADQKTPPSISVEEAKRRHDDSRRQTSYVHEAAHEERICDVESSRPQGEGTNIRWPNGKLKLKVSRGALARLNADAGGLRRNTITGSAKVWNDRFPEPDPWVRISLDGCSPDLIRIDSNTEPKKEKESNDECGVESALVDRLGPLTPPATFANLQHHSGQNLHVDGASAVLHEPKGAVSPASIADGRSSFSVDSRESGKSPRGLRKRLSNLRIRLAESRVRSAEALLGPSTGLDEALEGGAELPVDTVLVKSQISDANAVDGRLEHAASDTRHVDVDNPQHQGKGFRGRMSKWIKSARQAIIGACSGSGKRG